MSADQKAAGPPVITNPLSGEQITIRATAADTRGSVLEWELLLARCANNVGRRHLFPM